MLSVERWRKLLLTEHYRKFLVGIARVDRPHNLHRCETFENLYIFALTSVSFKDFPFLKDIIGGSLKICRSSG